MCHEGSKTVLVQINTAVYIRYSGKAIGSLCTHLGPSLLDQIITEGLLTKYQVAVLMVACHGSVN